MHAIDIRGNTTTRIGIVTAAVGVVVALTLGLILLNISEEQALTLPSAAPSVNQFERIKYLEDNTVLPVYSGSPARSLAELQMMEENVEFQPQVTGPTLSYLDIRWMEDNQSLPVYTGSSVRTKSNMEVEE